MGMYTAVAFHLEFPKNISKYLCSFLDSTFNKHELETNQDLRMAAGINIGEGYDVESLSSLLRSSSFEFRGWCYSLFAFMPSFDCYVVESRSSSKCVPSDNIKQFLTALLPYLVVDDGTILVRTCYEQSSKEQVYYYDKKSNSILLADGFKHEDEWATTHPSQIYKGDCDMSSDEAERAWGKAKAAKFIEKGYSALGFIPPLDIRLIKSTN